METSATFESRPESRRIKKGPQQETSSKTQKNPNAPICKEEYALIEAKILKASGDME